MFEAQGARSAGRQRARRARRGRCSAPPPPAARPGAALPAGTGLLGLIPVRRGPGGRAFRRRCLSGPPHLDPLHPAVPTASSVQEDRAALSRGSWGTGGEGAATRPQRMGSSSHRPGRLREGKSLPSSHSWQVETGTGLRAVPPPPLRAPAPHCYVRLCWVTRGASPAVPEDLSHFYSATVHALDGIRALTLSPQFLVSSAAFPGPLSEKRNHCALIHRS